MKTIIISYSYTGNNNLLAETLAKEIKADHISITDKRRVSVKTIMLDMIFHRKAQNLQQAEIIDNYDFVIFIGPFWIGKIARPLLPFLRHLRKNSKEYAFITISGGALGKNDKYEKELIKHTKSSPSFTNTFYTCDLFDKSDVNMKDKSTYLINEIEATKMVNSITANL